MPERHSLLQAWCELIAEEEAWDRAEATVRDARAHAEASGVVVLESFAARLEGRAAMAAGETGTAARAFERATAGFRVLQAAWETAVTEVEWAHSLTASGLADDARGLLESALPVLEGLQSVRELRAAKDLMDRLS